ncbi:MAG: hypothetical protein H6815_00450 [Phycisphaeraceae bacterium]|nr:hypothetical protein [Phycisphaerales bacterium]MCB9858894.1 hypothetical protein [Phycisphaeraceae bacterium]
MAHQQHGPTIEEQLPFATEWGFYSGTDTILVGYAMCFAASPADQYERARKLDKPASGNITKPAGVVTKVENMPDGTKRIYYIPLSGGAVNDIPLWCDESITAGNVLGMKAATYAFKKTTTGTADCAVAHETVDRSSTAGVVNCHYGRTCGLALS